MTPVISTERCILRGWTPADIEVIHELQASETVMGHQPGGLLEPDANEFSFEGVNASWSENGFGLWAVEHNQTHRCIGFVGIKKMPWWPHPEMSWTLHPDFWNRGLATECASAALRVGLIDLQLPVVIAVTLPENRASIRVMQKLGMEPTEWKVCPNRGVPVIAYVMTTDRWREGQSVVDSGS